MNILQFLKQLFSKESTINPEYLIKVSELMEKEETEEEYPKPKLKSKFIVNHDEILPIIDGDTGELFS